MTGRGGRGRELAHRLRPDDSEGSFLVRDVRHLIIDVLRTDRLCEGGLGAIGSRGRQVRQRHVDDRRNELGHLTEVIALMHALIQGDK